MRKRRLLPMNLQFFAEPDTGADGGGEPNNQQGGQNNQTQGQQSNNTAGQFDYEKLANLISGKQSVTEDMVLRNYFKNQGLSQEEAAQAMSQFKAQKAKNTPDVNAIQTELAQANEVIKKAAIEKEATMQALALGIDIKTIPYILKLAELGSAMGEDGKVNAETVKNALNKVLEDVPQLKPTATEGATGFRIGNPNQDNNNNTNNEDALKAAFGLV